MVEIRRYREDDRGAPSARSQHSSRRREPDGQGATSVEPSPFDRERQRQEKRCPEAGQSALKAE